MWKIFITLVYIFHVFFDSVNGAAFIIPSEEKPPEFADQEGCYVSQLKLVLPYNKPYSPQDGKSCVQYTCNSDNTTSGYSCGVIDFPAECSRVPGNLSLPYPQCCDGISCPQPDPEDLELNEKPEEEDQQTDLDPSADPGSETDVKSGRKATDYPGTEKSSDAEQPSDSDPKGADAGNTSGPEVIYIFPKDPHAPLCAYVIRSLGVRDDIRSKCLCVKDEPVNKPGAKTAVDPIDPGREPVIGPVADPIVEPAVAPAIEPSDKPVIKPAEDPIVEPIVEPPLLPVDPEPAPKNDSVIIIRPPRPPTDPVCAYPDVSPDGTSIARPPYCPPIKDPVEPPFIDPVPVPPVPPKRPPKPPICYYPTSGGANAKLYCPPRPDPVLDESEDAPSDLNHLPLRTLPVQPPVTVES